MANVNRVVGQLMRGIKDRLKKAGVKEDVIQEVIGEPKAVTLPALPEVTAKKIREMGAERRPFVVQYGRTGKWRVYSMEGHEAKREACAKARKFRHKRAAATNGAGLPAAATAV